MVKIVYPYCGKYRVAFIILLCGKTSKAFS